MRHLRLPHGSPCLSFGKGGGGADGVTAAGIAGEGGASGGGGSCGGADGVTAAGIAAIAEPSDFNYKGISTRPQFAF
jgi:hypothetical protein